LSDRLVTLERPDGSFVHRIETAAGGSEKRRNEMFAGAINRSHKTLTRLAILFALAVVALAIAGQANAQAYGGGVPYHQSAGAQCGDGTGARTILAYPARKMTTLAQSSNPLDLEYVYWHAELFVYTANGWLLYSKVFPNDTWNGSKAWLYAVANTSIYADPWRNYYSQIYTNRVVFSELPVGSYAVRETFMWQDGTSVQEWMQFSRNYTTSTVCRVG
jgi:hypothetical protein